MLTIKQACQPRPGTFDPARRDTVLDLGDLIEERVDAAGFFAENYITEGMKTLLTEGFRRLEGKSSQGVFKLTQAMGGGKTHNLLALGPLARHPEHRAPVMGSFYEPSDDPVRVVAFSGRESDAPLGIWGAIATQLGKQEQFADYYTPLAAPGQTAWVSLLKGEPLLIMLDELPPYFVNAASKSIGNSDLAAVTTTALANLLVAVGRDELRNVCVVLSDLRGAYLGGEARIAAALDDFEKETERTAMDVEPVRMNTDEFYHILRKRIFETLPDAEEVGLVAQGYAQAIRDAKQMVVTNASPEQFARQVAESYPFHPAIRDLYARFRENQGFQQTRGLIRLMRIVVSRIWATDQDPYLIAAHDLDLANQETLSEINQINNTLGNAIAHDIASGGQAVAEILDANRAQGQDAQDVMRLLLVASLANVPNAVKRLAVPEIIANLCAPGRDVAGLQRDVIARLATAAWYLHSTNDGRLHLRNVQNLIARVTTTAGAYLRDQANTELKDRLAEIFEQVIAELNEEGIADGDPQMQQARETLLPRFLAQFHSAICETFTTLYYPTRDRLSKVDFLMEFRDNRYDGEEQVREALTAKQKFTKDVTGETFRKKVEQRLFTQQSMPWSEITRRAATSPVWQWHRPDALDRMKADCVHKDIWREEGSYVDKGPFPKPETAVRVQEVARDDDTRVTKLRLTPVNGDTLYADVGGDATPASMRIDGREHETTELRVSFLATDSTGEHATGDPYAWIGRITLKSRDYLDGEQRMVEIRAAPHAPIRYTTDGSDPQVAGGAYDGPFAVPEGTRLVLAYAEKDGVVSETHRRELAERPVPKPIDKAGPTLILWAAGLRVAGAWTVATETESALKEGNYVQGTVLMVLRKQTAETTAFLKTASELGRSELGDSPFGASLVRHALYATWRAAETVDVVESLAWLRTELPDYWNCRDVLTKLLRYLSAMDSDHWRHDAAAARLVAGAVENDHV